MISPSYKKIIILFLLTLLIPSCSSAEKSTTPTETVFILESTATPEPTQTPIPQFMQDWVGTWVLWIGKNSHKFEVSFSAEGNQIIGTIEEEGESRMINANVSSDGITVIGDWESSSGNSGPVEMFILKGRQEFAGNFGDDVMFCGSREGYIKAQPCFTKIGNDWSGEWVAWLGPDETEVVLFFEQEGSEVDVMIYDFKGAVSKDGRTLIGEFNEFGISGNLEAKILDNMAQFTGNMINLFPFCGVRRGGPKPEVCLGP